MGLNLKLASGLVLFALCSVVYYKAFIANQPCHHTLHPMNEADKLPLTDTMIQRLLQALSIKTISSFEHQNQSAIEDYIRFIQKGSIQFILISSVDQRK